MHKEMRRKNQLLSNEESIELLNNGTSGVLALLDDNASPYAVPMNYVYCNSKIYFHSAKCGHKIDAVKNHNKASFCVITQDEVIAEEYTSYFKSVIAFGKIRILSDKQDILHAIDTLAKKYYPEDSAANRSSIISKGLEALCILELSVEHLTGKQAIELTKHN